MREAIRSAILECLNDHRYVLVEPDLSYVADQLTDAVETALNTTEETMTTPAQPTCQARLSSDQSPCDGTPAVIVRVPGRGDVSGCERHGAVLLAVSLPTGRVYPLAGHDQAALRVYYSARSIAGLR